MPLYEYECRLCKHHCDLLQKVNDAPASTCPACHQEGLSRLISAPAFHLKGSGWYVTDFRDKNKSKAPTEGDTNATSKATDKDKADSPKETSAPSKPDNHSTD